jgi:hypothetical protein
LCGVQKLKLSSPLLTLLFHSYLGDEHDVTGWLLQRVREESLSPPCMLMHVQ